MPENNSWYAVTDIAQIDSPALLIFTDRVKENIRAAVEMVGDASRLRPHIKTHKSSAVIRLCLDAGIRKFKCATISEAELLGMTGATDVLMAYQPIGPKLQRFIELIKKYPATEFSCLTDNLAAAQEQSAAFEKNGLTIPVYIDLNIGMDRTGIAPGDEAIALYLYLNSAKGIKVAGLHAYDGHIRDTDILARTIACDKAFALVRNLKTQLEQKGLAVSTIIAGGSPTFPIHAKRKEVECSPGTFVYWDKGYSDSCPEQPFRPAAMLLTRVISSISATRICTDLGHKSVAAENELAKRVYFLNATDLQPVGQSEEHLVLETSTAHSFAPGDILYGLPYHICPTVSMYERVYTVENGKISGEWKNEARDRRISV